MQIIMNFNVINHLFRKWYYQQQIFISRQAMCSCILLPRFNCHKSIDWQHFYRWFRSAVGQNELTLFIIIFIWKTFGITCAIPNFTFWHAYDTNNYFLGNTFKVTEWTKNSVGKRFYIYHSCNFSRLIKFQRYRTLQRIISFASQTRYVGTQPTSPRQLIELQFNFHRFLLLLLNYSI